jgi:hypothetical protein
MIDVQLICVEGEVVGVIPEPRLQTEPLLGAFRRGLR